MKSLTKSLKLKPGQLNFDDEIPLVNYTIQGELSEVLDSVRSMGAGIITIHDIIHTNKQVYIDEVRSFFQVMEIYGYNADVGGLYSACEDSPKKYDNLKYNRIMVMDQILEITEALKGTIDRLKKL